jgi:CheY-like chemotaxis protein
LKALRPCFLVVDDSDDDQTLIHGALKDYWTHPIHQVENSGEAINYLNGEGKFADRTLFPYPSMIMTDLQAGDDFHLLENLKRNPSFAIIPTIVFSGSTDPENIKQVYALGASCYLVKPGDYSELKTLMRKLVDFWDECEVPAVDSSGKKLATDGPGPAAGHKPAVAGEPSQRH